METLGQYIRRTRKKRGWTASETLKQSGIKGSATLYSQWENDHRIPTPEDLEPLVLGLGMNLRRAFQLWARAHMPTENLRRLYDVEELQEEAPTAKGGVAGPSSYPAAVTLQIQERDIELFKEHPESLSIALRCLAASNEHKKAQSIKSLVAGLGLSTAEGLKRARELVARGFVVEHNQRFRTPEGIQYLYMPDTEPFEAVRRSRIVHAARVLLDQIPLKAHLSGEAFRGIYTQKISPARHKALMAEIYRLVQEFLDPGRASEAPQEHYHQLVVVFGDLGGDFGSG